MRMLKSKWLWIIGGILAFVIVALTIEYLITCYLRPPLNREEALQRSTRYLNEFSKDLRGETPSLFEEQYDAKRGEWMFTFSNSIFSVNIIVDRCRGADVGGISEGCKDRVKQGK